MPKEIEIPQNVINLAANMDKILKALIVGNAERDRRTLTTSVKKLGFHVDEKNLNIQDAQDISDASARRAAQSYQRKAGAGEIKTFKEEVRDIKTKLEGYGFTEMEGKLYSDAEIAEIAGRVNGGR